MSDTNDNYTIALGLSYAIVAMERLPTEWQEQGELNAMRALIDRIVPDKGFRQRFISVSQSVLAGSGKSYTRPAVVAGKSDAN